MKGHPKYKICDTVTFTINDMTRTGEVYVVDAYGAIDTNDVSYDILVKNENCLYKHIEEQYVKNN